MTELQGHISGAWGRECSSWWHYRIFYLPAQLLRFTRASGKGFSIRQRYRISLSEHLTKDDLFGNTTGQFLCNIGARIPSLPALQDPLHGASERRSFYSAELQDPLFVAPGKGSSPLQHYRIPSLQLQKKDSCLGNIAGPSLWSTTEKIRSLVALLDPPPEAPKRKSLLRQHYRIPSL